MSPFLATIGKSSVKAFLRIDEKANLAAHFTLNGEIVDELERPDHARTGGTDQQTQRDQPELTRECAVCLENSLEQRDSGERHASPLEWPGNVPSV